MNVKRKIAFFDIDGTLTSEIDGSVPMDAAAAISEARDKGHLMFINTGRCMQNIEERFKIVGFDGYVCGCGTNIYCTHEENLKEILYIEQPHYIIEEILNHARKFELDILFESKIGVQFDMKHPLYTPGAIRQYNAFVNRNYDMSRNPENYDFTCDKFVVWFKNLNDLRDFRKVSDSHFDCIDRGGNFREFVPIGYSKASGIAKVLEYYNLSLDDAYAFGDSNNDLPMLSYVKHSVAMGNSNPESLFNLVSYKTTNASDGGIRNALKKLGFI